MGVEDWEKVRKKMPRKKEILIYEINELSDESIQANEYEFNEDGSRA